MLLQTENLTKYYDGFRALDDLNLTVAGGEIFGLLGPNGSGKTTALRLLLGFIRPTSGRALIAGHDCWHDSVAARRQVSYLPGELRLYENMTGRQLVRFLGQLRGVPAGNHVEALARRLEIDLDRPIADLSSGMKRKVALLQVLVPNAPLLILDEPTNTLDPIMRDELLAQLHRLATRASPCCFHLTSWPRWSRCATEWVFSRAVVWSMCRRCAISRKAVSSTPGSWTRLRPRRVDRG